jgi:hypothetical protein
MTTVEVSIVTLKTNGLEINTPAFVKWLKKNGFRVLHMDVKYVTLVAEGNHDMVVSTTQP